MSAQVISLGLSLSSIFTPSGDMGESSKFPKSSTFETPFLKFAVCPLNIHIF